MKRIGILYSDAGDGMRTIVGRMGARVSGAADEGHGMDCLRTWEIWIYTLVRGKLYAK